MNRVFVHVERVVLRGVGEAEKRALIGGLEDALRRMATDRAALSTLGAEKCVPALHLDGFSGTDSPRLGRQVKR